MDRIADFSTAQSLTLPESPTHSPNPQIAEAGNDWPIGELWLAWLPRLRRITAKARIPPADAEDLLQDVFLDLVRRSAAVVNPEAWLLGAAYRRCILWYRRQKRQGWLVALDGLTLDALAPPHPPGQKQVELRLDLGVLAARLPRRHRLLVALRFGLGLSVEEVAARLGYEASSIGKLTERALARMREGWPAGPSTTGAPPPGRSAR